MGKDAVGTVMNDSAGQWVGRVLSGTPTIYTIFVDTIDGVIRAENNRRSATDYVSADLTDGCTVVQNVLDGTKNGDSVIIKDSLDISGPLTISKAINFGGSNRKVTLEETNAANDLLAVTSDNVLIHDLTLDTQTNSAQAAFVMADHDNVSLQNCVLKGSANIFAVFWAGAAGATQAAPLYDNFNSMINCEVYDLYNGDGLSWSFQKNGLIRDVYQYGSRLAVFCCKDCLVDNYTYRKGAVAGSFNGIWVTNPSSNITFDHLDINTDGGTVYLASHEDFVTSNIKVLNSNFSYTTTGYGIWAKRVSDLLFANNTLQGNIELVVGEDANKSNIRILGNDLPQVAFYTGAANTLSDVEIADNIFHTFTNRVGQNSAVIHSYTAATITGRVYNNTFKGTFGGVTSNLLFYDNYCGYNKIEHHTASDTLTTPEGGSIHTNLGAGGDILLTLPQDAPAGTTFEFVVMTPVNKLAIDAGAAGALYVNGAKQADDAYIWADDEGESVKLVCDGAHDWIALYTQGTWTVV